MTDNAAHITEEMLSNAMLERPTVFTLHKRTFYIYSITLGKMQLISRTLKALNINKELLHVNSQLATLLLTKQNKRNVCRLIAILTAKSKKNVFNETFIQETAKYIMRHASNEDIASVLTVVLTSDDLSTYIKHIGLDKETERMQSVLRAKNNNNTYSFGCKSLYGQLIDRACERYGWTYDYVVWGISYINLQLMLADQSQTVYLTDEERKKVCFAPSGTETLRADDPKNIERIKAMNWK